MKIGYINGGISVSETFIYSLIKGITVKYPDTIFYSAITPFYKEGIKNIQRPFIYDSNFLENKILSYMGVKGKEFAIKKQQKKSFKVLENAIIDRDLLFIEYGTTAVNLLPLLQKSNKPFIVHFHGFDITSALSTPYYKVQLKIIFKLATYLIVASNHIRKLLILAGADSGKIKVVRLGVEPVILDPNIWEKRKQLAIKKIVFIGRLTAKKHPIALIKAFEIVRFSKNNIHLDIVGDGPLLNECKQLVKDLSLEKVITFHGKQPHDKAISYLNNAWLYAQHSVTAMSGDQEGFAISLAEAALYKLPVVATLHNGIPENVVDGKTGFLVKEFDFEAMAEKMLLLLNDADLAEKMGQKGREHISELCKPKVRVKKILELIEDAITC